MTPYSCPDFRFVNTCQVVYQNWSTCASIVRRRRTSWPFPRRVRTYIFFLDVSLLHLSELFSRSFIEKIFLKLKLYGGGGGNQLISKSRNYDVFDRPVGWSILPPTYLRNRSPLAVNGWVIIHCLEVSCKEDQITSAKREWFICLQLTESAVYILFLVLWDQREYSEKSEINDWFRLIF